MLAFSIDLAPTGTRMDMTGTKRHLSSAPWTTTDDPLPPTFHGRPRPATGTPAFRCAVLRLLLVAARCFLNFVCGCVAPCGHRREASSLGYRHGVIVIMIEFSSCARRVRPGLPPRVALEWRLDRMVAAVDIERHLLGERRLALRSPIPCQSRTRPLPQASLHAHASVRHPCTLLTASDFLSLGSSFA